MLARFLLLLATVLLAAPAFAQEEDEVADAWEGDAAPRKLIVGTHPVPPFILQNPDGSFSGISIEVWDHVAKQLGVDYEIRVYEVKDLLSPPNPEIDVVVSANIGSRSEVALDMTHAFYSTGLAIAVRPEAKSTLAVLLGAVTSTDFLGAAAGVLVALVVMGLLMWAVERNENPEEFGGRDGIVNGLFWSLEALIGYGDPTHRTRAGRALGIAWVFVCMLGISGLTARMSSELTVSQLSYAVSGPQDLPRVALGTVSPSQGARYLDARGLKYTGYPDAKAALQALDRGEVVAVVYEAPILQYGAREFDGRIEVLPGTFQNHGYGFGLRTGSPLREDVNRALLAYIESDAFEELLTRYLGAH